MAGKLTRIILFIAFLVQSSFLPVPQARAADTVLGLPAPGTMVELSRPYVPVLIKGVTVHPDNPLMFDFLVDTGHSRMQGEELKAEGQKLIKYFLASLTIPENDF